MTRQEAPRILVVDDDRDTCRNLSDILTDLGYQVDYAHDGPAALALVGQRPYDVALLDQRMPGMDGVTLYRAIKKQRPGTVSLLVTAYANTATAQEALAAGAWKVVSKPVDFRKLLGLVNEALGQPLVLVVDDDHDLCASLWDLLRERGFRVSLAYNGREAAEQLEQLRFQVVLIDLRLPDSDGCAVLGMVRAATPTARTILITGHRAETHRPDERTIFAGADAVCYKPFDIPELLKKLGQLAAADAQDAGEFSR
jgi:CheY-like chemotaxis protein